MNTSQIPVKNSCLLTILRQIFNIDTFSIDNKLIISSNKDADILADERKDCQTKFNHFLLSDRKKSLTLNQLHVFNKDDLIGNVIWVVNEKNRIHSIPPTISLNMTIFDLKYLC